MRSSYLTLMFLLATPCLVASCSHDTATGADRTIDSPLQPQLDVLSEGEWSAPVKLGPPISVPRVTDGNATLSRDGLSLYYDSDRIDLPGAQGARDIWVSRRPCTDALDPECAWQTPVNLGPQINTQYVDGLPTLSDDGHLLFFLSHRSRADCPVEPNEPDPTRPCDADIYVSWRSNPNDDLGWGPAVSLPPGVNTSDEDNVSDFVRVGEPGSGNLYFDRAPAGTSTLAIYYVPIRVTARGAGVGPTVAVLGPVGSLDEINLPNGFDALITLRADGREMFFTSTTASRPGGQGALDIWTSTRRSPHDPWSTPTNVAEVNSTRADLASRLSHDGLTLLFTSNRDMPAAPCIAAGLPSSCGWDIYMSTRKRQP